MEKYNSVLVDKGEEKYSDEEESRGKNDDGSGMAAGAVVTAATATTTTPSFQQNLDEPSSPPKKASGEMNSNDDDDDDDAKPHLLVGVGTASTIAVACDEPPPVAPAVAAAAAAEKEDCSLMDIVAKRAKALNGATDEQDNDDNTAATKFTNKEQQQEEEAIMENPPAVSPTTLSREPWPVVVNRQPGAYAVVSSSTSRPSTISNIINNNNNNTGEGYYSAPSFLSSRVPTEDLTIISSDSNNSNNDDSSLVEALPVIDPPSENAFTRMELAQPVDQEKMDQLRIQKACKDKKYKTITFCIVSVACLALVLSLSFGLNEDALTDDSSETPPPPLPNNTKTSPTTITGQLPPMEDDFEILYYDLPAKTQESLFFKDTPQYQAWEWILQHPNISTYPFWRKKQIFAMATFYYSFDGPNWPEETLGQNRWMDVTTSECSWVLSNEEVAYFYQLSIEIFGPNSGYDLQHFQPCNPYGELQSLMVHQLYLPHDFVVSIPPEIQLLTSLHILSIGNSQIHNTNGKLLVPPELIQLPKLETINFQASGLGGTTNIVLEEIFKMTNLKHCFFGQNQLSGPIPSEIGRMTSLEYFRLDDMEKKITGPLPSEIGLLTKLTALEVARNSLTGFVPSELGLLSSSMRRLALNGNQFSGSLPTELWEFSHLEELELSNLPNIIRGSIPSDIFMAKLTILSLHGNPHLSGTIPDQLCFTKMLTFDCSDVLCGCDCHCRSGNSNETNF